MAHKPPNEEGRAHSRSIEVAQRLSAAFDGTTDRQLLVTADIERQFPIAAINRSYVATSAAFGISIEEEALVGKPLSYLAGDVLGVAPEAVRDIIEKYTAAATQSRQIRFEEKVLVNGRDYFSESTITPVFDAAGSCRSLLYSSHDITEQREAEIALRASEERLRLALKATGQGFYDLDLQSGEAIVSAEYASMLGYDPETFRETTRDWSLRLHPEDRPRVFEAYQEHLSGASNEYSVEFRQRTADGGWIWTLSSGEVVERDDADKPTRMLGTHTDISERKNAEEKMHHVQKLESLGVLAGGIAHDFNNLLMAMLGNADLAIESMTETHPAREFVDGIKNASQNAAELCRQMMAYAGKGRFVIQDVDLTQLVHEMVQILRVSIGKDATLRFDLDPDLPPVRADASQIQQVVMNLIMNASDALGEEAGTIYVSSGSMDCDPEYIRSLALEKPLPEGRYVYLEIVDTGVGMDEETQRKVFDPFFTTKFVGRGLGMAATLGIIRGHQGAIKVYSEKGRGSTFKVLLPASQSSAHTNQNKETEPIASLSGGTILLVDDDEQVREVGRKMLTSLGFDVVLAVDGFDALERIRTTQPAFACVILDLTMPRMGGVEAYRKIRQLQTDIPVILSSGYNEQETTQRFSGKGRVGFVQKPYGLKTLRAVLQKALVPGDEPGRD